MQPKFSVVMPVYNVEKYLRNSIQSILNQTISDYELILVDDGSPDNCPKICDEYAAPVSYTHLGYFLRKLYMRYYWI